MKAAQNTLKYLRQRIIWILLVLGTLLIATSAGAGTWEQVGMSGGGAQYGLSISPHDPNIMFVSCDMSNIFRSADGGRTWKMLDMKMIFKGQRGEAHFHPTDPNLILYATMQGLMKSTDAGLTWTFMPGTSGDVRHAFISRDNPDLWFYAIATKGLYRSTDAGATWSTVSGLTNGTGGVHAMFGANGKLWAATDAGIFRSDDSGATWTLKAPTGTYYEGMCGAVKNGVVTLYASVNEAVLKGMLYKSTDGGETWASANGNLPTNYDYYKILCAENDPDTVYVNDFATRYIYKSSNGGTSWASTTVDNTPPGGNMEWGWLDYKMGGIQAWGGRLVKGIAICPTNSQILAAANTAATYRTDDGGGLWRQCYGIPNGTPAKGVIIPWYTNGINLTSTWHYHVDPNEANRHYISYTDIGFASSTDSGASWANTTTGLTWVNTTYQIAFHPTIPGTIFTASSTQHDIPWTGMAAMTGLGGVSKSTNYGVNWTKSSTGLPTKPATSIVTDGKSLYVAMMDDGVYRSDDWGATWTKKSTGLGTADNQFVFNLTVDSAGVIYCTIAGKANPTTNSYDTMAGLYRSTDRGETWSALLALHSAHRVTVDPSDPKRLYLSVWDGALPSPTYRNGEGGVWISSDGGATWKQERFTWKNWQDWALLRISHVAIDPANPNILYTSWYSSSQVNPWKGGIFVSYDRGATWQDYDDVPFVNPTEVSIVDSVMYVTTFGAGVWKKQLTATPLSITTGSLAGGITNTVYNSQLNAAGGQSPYSWSISDEELPNGLSLNTATGVISGIPAEVGTNSFTVKVADANGQTDTRSLSITIIKSLTITTDSLSGGVYNTAYSQTLVATGGSTPYIWTLASGLLPTGLSLSSAGVISGIPTLVGITPFTVKVTDANGLTDTQSLSLMIANPVNISNTTLSSGVYNTAYSQTLAATGGTTPYIWTLASGTPPTGLTISTAGVISGTPTAVGTVSFSVKATDANGLSDTQLLSIKIVNPLILTTSSLSGGVAGTAYSQALAASGGTVPYAWSVTSGTLPAGLILSTAGVISGTPTTVGASTFTVQVADSDSLKTSRSLSLTITGSPELVVTSVSSAKSTVTRGSASQYQATVKNNGTAGASASKLSFYLSTDKVLSTSDYLIGTVSVGSLEAGSQTTVSLSAAVSRSLSAGKYYVIAVADSSFLNAESNESNNTLSTSSQITVR